MKIQLIDVELKYVPVLTDAPKDYDGFGTIEVEEFGWPIEGRTRGDARLVLVREEHLEWQTSRYLSGIYVSWRGDEALDILGISIESIRNVLYSRLTGTTNN